MRRANRRDSNEREIIDGLRALGCCVIQEHKIDLWVLPPNSRQWFPLEVKTKRGKLTPFQVKLHGEILETYDYKIAVVTSLDDAINALNINSP